MQESKDPIRELVKTPLLSFAIVYSATIMFCVAASIIPALSEEAKWIKR